MSFNFEALIKGAEFRGKQGGTSDNGNPWLRLKFEVPTISGDSDDLMVSVPKDNIGDVYSLGLRKGDIVNMVVRARVGMTQKGGNYDYVQLADLPVIVEDEE